MPSGALTQGFHEVLSTSPSGSSGTAVLPAPVCLYTCAGSVAMGLAFASSQARYATEYHTSRPLCWPCWPCRPMSSCGGAACSVPVDLRLASLSKILIPPTTSWRWMFARGSHGAGYRSMV